MKRLVRTLSLGEVDMSNNQSLSEKDWRNIANGFKIPKEGYCDQPYVVITDDGNWLCVLTTGKGEEGEGSQHIISTISKDKGKTWTEPVDIEPPGPPEASWVMPLKVPYGRIYVFYTYNKDNIREVIADTEESKKRVDTLGGFMFKYSDDNGVTWSKERYEIPMRLFKIDLDNPYEGRVLFFWSVGKPIIHDGTVYIAFSKVGRFGEGFITKSEGAFLKSSNILYEKDPKKIVWETLPDGDEGLTAPFGPIAEEHNVTSLSDGSLYCTYRTIDGYNCHAYSRDGGHTWTPPQYATYTPSGRKIKHPRAANFVRKFSNGKYVLWFHNHGGKRFNDIEYINKFGKGINTGEEQWDPYEGRNPAWLCGGIEKGGYIYWSQPEIVLYDNDPSVRMSYPDFIEEQGQYFITETQKTIARVHRIDNTLLEGLWEQFNKKEIAKNGIILEIKEDRIKPGNIVEMPELPDLKENGGFSFELWINFFRFIPGQIILDTRGSDGRGITLTVTDTETVRISLNDGNEDCSWDCDRGLLRTNIWHHVVVTVDGGPKIITFVVDGMLCDGGEYRQFGWGRFSRNLGNVAGSSQIKIMPFFDGQMKLVRVYNRYLRTSEAVGNFKAGYTTGTYC